MSGITQVLASYGGRNLDPYWPDVLVLFDCDAARYWKPGPIFGDATHGWVAMQLQEAAGIGGINVWYHSPSVEGPFTFTGKVANVFGNFSPDLQAKNSTVCLGMTVGSGGPITFNSARLSKVPINILGPDMPGQITTNIDLRGARFLATNGTDFYLFGGISSWPSFNEVYKSTDNGVTWNSLGTLSGTTFPVSFGGSEPDFGNAIIRKIGSRWFMLIQNPGFVGCTDGTRVFYTDSADPVTGWTPTTGANIDPTDFNDEILSSITYDGVGTHYIARARVDYTVPVYTGSIYRSTDGGATWVLDYTFPIVNNNSQIISMTTTSPNIGGTIRATVVGINQAYWLEHTIGDPNGTWTVRQFNDQPTDYLSGGKPVPYVYIDYLNSGGVSMGAATSELDGSLCYTNGVSSDVVKIPTPYYFYSQYPIQLAASEYETYFPAYPLGYIDTTFYKWGTAPGWRGHNTGPGSLRCNGGRTYSRLYTNWDLLDKDWTIEFWMYTSTASQTCTMFNIIDPLNGYGPFNFMLIGGNLSFFAFDNTNSFLANMNSVVPLPTDSWQFITAERNGGTITLYLNGISVATSTFSPSAAANWPGLTNWINSGAYSDGALPYYGWLDDIRVTQNVARYNGNFQPPWRPFPDRGPDPLF